MSALPPKADMRQRIERVCFVPKTEVDWKGSTNPARVRNGLVSRLIA